MASPLDELLELEELLEELDEELLEELDELLDELLEELEVELEDELDELLDELDELPELDEVPPQEASDRPHNNTANRKEIPTFIRMLPRLIPALITSGGSNLINLKTSRRLSSPVCSYKDW